MKMAKLISAALSITLLGTSTLSVAQAAESALDAPAMLGTVLTAGDPDFDSDSIVNTDDSQWRWLSYPESRILINPGTRPEYDGGMNLKATLFVNGMQNVDNLQKVQLGADSGSVQDAQDIATAWYPYKLTAEASYASGANIHMDEFFVDKNTFVRLYNLTDAAGQTLCVSVRDIENMQVLDDGTLLADKDDYWLVFHILLLNDDTAPASAAAPVQSGADWKACFSFTESEAKVAFSMTMLPKNVGNNTLQAALDISAAAIEGRLSDKLEATKAYWDEKLGSVPAPTLWGIQGGLDAKGVTEEQHRRSFYAAWAFNYQNILEPVPESGYPYYQVTLGKASGYGAGPTGAPNSCEWESMFNIQQLALVEPEIAWSALEGFIQSIEESGKMPGESLPSQKAHTAWVCYQNLPDLDKLRELYPKIRQYLLWRAENPHWGIGGRVYEDEKDISFVTQWLTDVNYAIQICEELGEYADISMWEDMKVQMGENARDWFFTPDEGAPEDIIYNWYFSDSGLHYQYDRLEDVENYICSALYADFPADLTERLIQHYIDFEDPEGDLVGFDFYKYGDGYNVANGLFERSQTDARLEGMWERYTNAAIRNVVKTVEFSEESRPDRYEPQGVQPSTFTASTVVAFTYMNNGVRIDLGRPVAIKDDALRLTEDSNIDVYTIKGNVPTLPKTVTAEKDGAAAEAYVAWEAVDDSRYAEAGSFQVTGRAAGSEQTVTATIHVYDGEVSFAPVAVSTLESVIPSNLPDALPATYEDGGSERHCIVHFVWDEMNAADFALPGTVRIGGTIVENGQRVQAAVTVYSAPIIESETGNFRVEQQQTLQLTLKDANGQTLEDVDWAIADTGNDDIAGLNQNGLLLAVKPGVVTVTATDRNIGLAVEQEVVIEALNAATLAYGGTATASGQADEARSPEKALDNDMSTMWRAANNNDEQWFQVELPKAAPLTGLHIRWFEGNQPKTYLVEVSADGQQWTTVSAKENAAGTYPNDHSEIIVFDRRYTAKYIRIQSSQAGSNAMGIIEFQAFGSPEIATEVQQISISSATGEFAINVKNLPLQLTADITPAYASDGRIIWSVTDIDGSETTRATISETGLLSPKRNGTVTVTATAIDGSGCSASAEVVLTNQDTVNVALGKPASATTDGGGQNIPASAVDGDRSTRWGSASGAPQEQHFTIDLNDEYSISSVNLYFDSGAYPVDFKLQYSLDGESWTDLADVTGNNTPEVTYTFAPVQARYVRTLSSRTTNAEWGYSIWEFEVYGRVDMDTRLLEAAVSSALDARNTELYVGAAPGVKREFDQALAAAEDFLANPGTDEAALEAARLALLAAIDRLDIQAGDLDGDGTVTITDVMQACRILARKNAGETPSDEELLRGDLDEDGDISIADIMEICKILARQE